MIIFFFFGSSINKNFLTISFSFFFLMLKIRQASNITSWPEIQKYFGKIESELCDRRSRPGRTARCEEWHGRYTGQSSSWYKALYGAWSARRNPEHQSFRFIQTGRCVRLRFGIVGNREALQHWRHLRWLSNAVLRYRATWSNYWRNAQGTLTVFYA